MACHEFLNFCEKYFDYVPHLIIMTTKSMGKGVAWIVLDKKLILDRVYVLSVGTEWSGLLNPTAFVWVPWHSDVEGNETADELARLGSRSEKPVTHSACITVILNYFKARWMVGKLLRRSIHKKSFFLSRPSDGARTSSC